MKNRCMESALACVGAVIGAGFVSGREVMSFFSQYGRHSWWLILISALTMLLLAALCMRRSSGCLEKGWCELYRLGSPRLALIAEIYIMLLLSAVGGAMVSASGHMVSLLWASDWAYSIGAVGTLLLVWFLSRWGVKQLSLISGILTILFLGMMLLILKNDASPAAAALPKRTGSLWLAAISAVAYGAMNIAIAIGVVCRVGQSQRRSNDRQSALFAFLLICLLFLSNYLYLKHPELSDEAFPVVRLFNGFGRTGYRCSAFLLYLAILTTLFAVVYALREAMETFVASRTLSAALTLGIPLAISTIGFTEIVEGWYMPIGLGCLALIFLPLALQNNRRNP